jgi:hypothetical protein
LNPLEKEVLKIIFSKLDNITVENKFQFGFLILEFVMSEFDYMFNKHNIYDNNEQTIILTIKQEYLAVLSASVFNPIRLPMVSKPKEWTFSQNYDGSIQLENVGGYLLDEFNE